MVSTTSPVNEPGFSFERQALARDVLLRIEPTFFSSACQAAERAGDEFAAAQPLRRRQ